MNAARCFVMSATIALALGSVTAAAQQGVYGTIPGEFDVNAFGEATYSMPIFAPVGPGGVRPNVSLEYRHRGGDGVAGLGWSIGGLSAITRCPQTVTQDNKAGEVRYDSNDRYCLNGQRLVLTSGTYGGAGSEYRTEVDTLAKIIASTQLVGNAPREFVVTLADGSRHYYGHFYDSSLGTPAPPTGSGSYRLWRPYYIQDRYNNGMLLTWEKNETTGEHRLTRIEYTRNDGAGVTYQYRVAFTYENKPTAHQRSGYIWGAPWSENKRLTNVAVQRNESGSWQTIYNYNLAYLPIADSPHHSLLEKIQQCGPTQCLNGSYFEWADGQITAASYGTPTTTATVSPPAVNATIVGDFNGDGQADIATRHSTGTNWNQYGIAIYYASGGSLQTASTNMWGFCSGYQPIEFDGDGRTDLLCIDSYAGTSSPATLYVKQSTDSGWVNHNVGTATWDSTYGTYRVQTADVNGDGLSDLIHASSGGTWQIRLNTGGAFGSPTVLSLEAATVMSLGTWANMDDDAALELVTPYNDLGFYIDGIAVHQHNSTTGQLDRTVTKTGLNITPHLVGAPYTVIPLPDINGDGLSDLAYRKHGSTVVHTRLNLGNDFGAEQATTIPSGALPMVGRFADANNDGRDDLFLQTGSGFTWQAHSSNGTTFTAGTGSLFSDTQIDFADVTGDGHLDAVHKSSSYTTWNVHPQIAELEAVTTFWDGRGNWQKATYAPLSTMTDHYHWPQLPAVNYPERLFHGPIYVVDHFEANTGTGVESYSYAEGVRGDSYVVDYRYYDAKVHNTGRGFLGFRWIRTADSRQAADVVYRFREFRQEFPFIGRLDYDTVWHGSYPWIEADFTWATVGSGPPYRARMEVSTTKEYEVGGAYNGQLIRTITYDPTYETTYGNLDLQTTTVAAHSGETYTTTVDYTLLNLTTPWCLGLPDAISVTRSGTGMTTQTRSLDNVFNTSTCRLESRTDTSETDPNRRLVTSFTYDVAGNVKTVKLDSANGAAADRLTEFFYDASYHLPTSTTRYATGEPNHTESTAWNYRLIVPTSRTTVGNQTTLIQYDEFGRPDLVTHPDTTTSDYVFVNICAYCVPDALTNEQVIGSDGSHTMVHRDSYGRPLSDLVKLAPNWSMYEWRYDLMGNVAAENLPYLYPATPQFVRTHQYDLTGRRIQTVEPLDESTPTGSTTTWSYERFDTRGTRQPQNQTTTERRDAIGRTARITDALNGQTQYAYNAFDQLTSTTDPAGHVTTIAYNHRGDKTSMTSPDLGQWLYEDYSVFGELTRVRDAKLQVVLYGYDQLGRLDWRSEPDFPGANPSIPDDDLRTDFTYHTTSDHRLGLPKEEIFPSNYKREYGYDSYRRQNTEKVTIDGTMYTTDFSFYTSGTSKGKLQRVTYPTSTSGVRAIADYEYDNVGMLKRVRDGSTVYYTIDQVDALAHATQATLGNGVVETRSYDSATFLLESILAVKGANPPVQNLAYGWDASGNLKQRVDALAGKTEVFTYDALDRLDTQKLNNTVILDLDYTSGGDGNIAFKTAVGNYAYGGGSGGPHAVTAITGIQTNSYAYDANGNMTNRDGDAITWYSHNLPKKIHYGADSAEFWYGTDRGRYKQVAVSGGGTVTTRYIGRHYEIEQRSGVTIHRHYILAGERAVAQYERRSNGTNTVQYLHRDHQSNVVATTSSSGAVQQRWEFEPFGTRWRTVGSSPDDTERGYTGHEHLDSVALIHMNGRVQDPLLGRFISADPFVPNPFDSQSFNRYSYVRNNPLTLVDPSGFQDIPITYVDINDIDARRDRETKQYDNWLMGLIFWEWESQSLIINDSPPYATSFDDYGFDPAAGAGGASVAADARESWVSASPWYFAGAFDSWINDVLSESVIPVAPVQAFGQPPTPRAEFAYDLGPTLPWIVGGTGTFAGKAYGAARTGTGVGRVRHHTSPEALASIRQQGVVNPSRGGGVHVETQPFGPARTAPQETGAFGRGAYVEFDSPLNVVPTTVGPRSTGVIPTTSPLPLEGANPAFVTRPWWKFWGD